MKRRRQKSWPRLAAIWIIRWRGRKFTRNQSQRTLRRRGKRMMAKRVKVVEVAGVAKGKSELLFWFCLRRLLVIALKETNCQVLPLVLQYLNRSNSASVVDSIIPSRRTVVAGTKDRHATIVAPVAIGINSSSSSRSNSRVAGDSRNFEKKTLLYRFFFDIIETAKITALCKNDEKMRKMFKTIFSKENGANNRRSPRSADNAAVVDFNCDRATVGRHWHHRSARSRPLRLWHCAPLIGHCQSSWVSLPLFWKTKIEAIHL